MMRGEASRRGAPLWSPRFGSRIPSGQAQGTAPTWHVWCAAGLAVLFTAVIFYHNQQKYLAFQTIAPDADRFSQAIWNVWHGRPLFSTIQNGSILGNHFSPYFALLSPLLLIWEDIRVLYLAQAAHIALCGLVLWRMVDRERPTLSLPFLMAFYLNPQLHQIALYELRRIPFAMPWLALVALMLHTKQRKWMVVGIVFALLTKEDMGLIVFGIGAFLLLIQRDWRWGVPLMIVGVGWTAVMLEWVIPTFQQGDYPQLNYFSAWGDSPADMITAVLSDPIRAIKTMFDANSLASFWEILLPFALILPFIGGEYLLITVPLVGLMLLSNEPTMHALERWYLAPVLPFVGAAVSVALIRLPKLWAWVGTVALLLCTLIAYRTESALPLGNHHQPWLYETTERSETAWHIINDVPDKTHIMTQVAFSTQLAQRDSISVYPWNDSDQPVDYVLFGEAYNAYPLDKVDVPMTAINEMVKPETEIVAEGRGIYLLRPNAPQPLPNPLTETVEQTMQLDGFEIAVADENGIYQRVDGVEAADNARVTLYWSALVDGIANRTISVRVMDSAGALVGQHDGWPVAGSRPTSVWQAGWQLRDVHYLDVGDGRPPYTIELLLYDSVTQERIPFDSGADSLTLGIR